MARHRIALIGLGMAVAPHARSLLDLRDRVEVVCAFSRSEARRRVFAERFDFPRPATSNRSSGTPSIAAVMILTPPTSDWWSALRRGHAHPSGEAARALDRACTTPGRGGRRGRRQLGVVFNTVSGGFGHLRALLRQGTLGELAVVNVSCPWWRPQSYYDEPGRSRATVAAS